MEREHTITFKISNKDQSFENLTKLLLREEIRIENMRYLYSKYNNSRFLT